MKELTEELIRQRAYRLWQAAGEPYGKMDMFWYAAEKELLQEREGLEGRRLLEGQNAIQIH